MAGIVKKKVFLTIGISLFLLYLCCACTLFKEAEEGEKVEYDICDESMLPQELKDIISSKQEEAFNLTYSNNTYTYIVICAGTQNRNDVGVEIEELYKDDNAIYVEGILRQTASAGDAAENTVSFPYTVVRIQKTTCPIIFEQ